MDKQKSTSDQLCVSVSVPGFDGGIDALLERIDQQLEQSPEAIFGADFPVRSVTSYE